MSNKVQYDGAVDNGPSPIIWSDCPITEMREDPTTGVYFFDNFERPHAFASATPQGGYTTFQDTSATIQAVKRMSTGRFGVLELSTAGGVDNDQASIQQDGSGKAGLVRVMTGTLGAGLTPVQMPKKVWYEAAFRLTSAALAENAVFIGLMEENSSLNNALVDNTGALVDKDAIGFHAVAHASLVTFNFVYRKAGQAMQTAIASVIAGALNTWYKAGFKFDPELGVITAYVDAVKKGAVTGLKNPSVTPPLFPDGEELGPIGIIKAGEGAIKKLEMDWHGCAMEF